jgi:CRP/FNR family cyclic AMP-dependent transcriptional regulator
MARDEICRSLKDQRFTRGLPAEHVSLLAALARPVKFRQDEVIFRVGERSEHLYLLLSGSVCVEARSPFYAICVAALGPGDAFGWSSLAGRHDTVFQVRAREDSTALCLDSRKLLALCEQDPSLGLEIFRRLSEMVAGRVRALEARLAEFCGVPRGERLPVVADCSAAGD